MRFRFDHRRSFAACIDPMPGLSEAANSHGISHGVDKQVLNKN